MRSSYWCVSGEFWQDIPQRGQGQQRKLETAALGPVTKAVKKKKKINLRLVMCEADRAENLVRIEMEKSGYHDEIFEENL